MLKQIGKVSLFTRIAEIKIVCQVINANTYHLFNF